MASIEMLGYLCVPGAALAAPLLPRFVRDDGREGIAHKREEDTRASRATMARERLRERVARRAEFGE